MKGTDRTTDLESHQGRRQILKAMAATVGVCLFPHSGLIHGAEPALRLRMGAQTNAWGVPIKDYGHLLEIAETLVGLGYEGFETNFGSLSSQEARAADCRRDFAKRHIQFIAPHTGGVFYDKAKWSSELANFERVAVYSAQMGASHMIVSGKEVPQAAGKLDLDAVRVKAEALNQLGAVASKKGLRLCYHNHEAEFRDTPSEMSYLLTETDPANLALCLDVGHCYGLIDPVEFTAVNFRRIAIFHLRDERRNASGKVVYSEPGKGKINLRGIVAPLLKSNWQGWLEVEEEQYYPKPMPNPDEAMEAWRRYLKRLTGV